ncbi:MAG: ATP-binding protein [Pseudomonadota bacterium]
MTEMPTGFADDEACLKARIGLVSLHLSRAVHQLRALRGEGREDHFAGVLMRDADVAALCAGLIADPLPDPDTLTGALNAAQARYASRLAQSSVPPRIERVRLLYGLTDFEETVLMTCLSAALDPRIARVLGYLNEDMAQQHLTIGLAQRLYPAAPDLAGCWQALSDGGTLLRHGLLARTGPLEGSAALRVPQGVLDALVLEPAAADLAAVVPFAGTRSTPGPLLIVAAKPLDAFAQAAGEGPLWLSDGAEATREETMRFGLMAALAGERHWLTGWDDASREDRRALAHSLGVHAAVVTARPALWDGLGIGWHRRSAPPATSHDLQTTWATIAHPDFAAILAEDRASSPVHLCRLAHEAADPKALRAALDASRSGPMHGLADRVPTPFTLDDIELPDRLRTRLNGFAARRQQDNEVLENWGLGRLLGAERGGVALFLGPSGVGKTMAAGAVARAAGLALWRVNLATVVSKYIGETEANLDRIFSAADKGEVMLFFDEAEALFSKRADVKDARDRYANMEMAYLLQRIESFAGMAVLASNMGASLEPSMMRRFDLVLDFPAPDTAARRRIWARLETSDVPLGSCVDLDEMAERFDLTGGHIRQAILSAAHAGVVAGRVTQRDLMRAVAREYAKLGRPVRREEFGPHFADVRGAG